MSRIIVLAILANSIVGCAASAPEEPASNGTQPSAGVVQPGPAPVADSAGAASEAGVENQVEYIEAPSVPRHTVVAKEPELVCYRERPTGSHRLEKICRYKSDVDAERVATQEKIRDMALRSSKSTGSR